MTSNTEIMTMNNTTNNSNTTNSTDNKSNNESYSSLQSKFAVHVRHDKRKKFFTRATSAKITVKEFFDFIKTAYQVNESLEQIISDVVNNENGDINDNSNGNVNWTKLANNQLINQLITIEQQQQQQKLQELNKKENECQTSTTNANENQQIESTTNQNNRIRSRQSQLSVLKASDSITSQQIPASTPTAAASSSVASSQTTNQNQQTTEVKQSSINMLHDMMDEIICEGILDKVLPYLTPTDLQLTTIIPTINNNSNNNITQPIIKKQQTIMGTTTSGDHKKIIKHGTKDSKNNQQSTSGHQSTSKTSLSKGNNDQSTTQTGSNKKDDGNQIASANNNGGGSKSTLSVVAEPEVEIHVCDEVKHLKKDFRCPQSLLISKMGYFAEITAGQRLEDIDISVHCDIGIFDWLMRWTKKDLLPQDQWPQLESQCVAPILVSAVFLQMDPLIEDCLLFCHQHMNEVLKTNTNLSCLNDVIITRLAAMYTNTELELIKDKKDKIISRLYCKLILSLGEPVAQSIRGHWSTLAGIYKCSKCLKLIINSTTNIASEIQCIPSQMYVSLNGNIINQHERDLNWNLSEYIIHLYHELKTWRKVYWRLWSVCHYLRCQTCLTLFPVHQMSWCCSHTEQPQFFIIENQQQQTTIPVGRYACCGARTYRFEILTNTSQGCIFKEHIPDVKHPRDAAILQIFNQHRHVIEQSPPQIMIPERLTKLVARDATNNDCMKLFNNKEILWWEGIELAPTRQKLGLLGKMCFVGRTTSSKHHQTSNYQQNDNDDTSSEYSSSDDDDDDNEYNPYDDDSESLTSDVNGAGGAGRVTTTAGAAIDHNINGSLIDENDMSSTTSSNDDDDDNDNTDNDQRVQSVNRTELSLNIFNTTNTMNKSNRYHDTSKRAKRRHRRHKHHRSSHHHGHHHHRHGQHNRNKDNGSNVGRYWSPTLSARSNQDLQRDFEETAMQQITDFLSRRTAGVTSTILNSNNNNPNGNTNNTTTTTTSTMCSGNNVGGFDLTTSNKNNYYSVTTNNNNLIQQKQSINNKIQYANIWNHHIIPTGGIYQRLEGEWNELYRQQSQQAYHQTNKHNKSSTSYIVKPKFKVHRNNNNTSNNNNNTN